MAGQFVSAMFAPNNATSYLAQYFEQSPSVMRRPLQQHSFYSNLFSLEDVGDLMSRFQRDGGASKKLLFGEEDDWNLVRKVWVDGGGGGGWTTQGVRKGTSLTHDEARGMFEREGYTLVVNHVEKYHDKVALVVGEFESALGHQVSANLYATMPSTHERGTQGFAAHFDWMDGIIIQVAGCKRWRIYDRAVQLPVPDMVFQFDTVASLESLTVVGEFDLSAGSALTIPRGWVHEAATNCSADIMAALPANQPSLHLTFGLEAAVTTSVEVLLHYYLESLGESMTLDWNAWMWTHLCIHAVAILEELGIALRKSLPSELLHLSKPSVVSQDFVESIQSSAKMSWQGLDFNKASALAQDLLGDECSPMNQQQRKGLHKPLYILPFLQQFKSAWEGSTEPTEQQVAQVWNIAIERMTPGSIGEALERLLAAKQRSYTAIP